MTSNRLSGLSAIVTGSARGIGLAIARRYVREGANVLMSDIDEDALAKAAGGLGQPFLRVDVREKEQVQQLADMAMTSFGKVDVLVNNAGVFRPGALLDITEEEFDFSMGVNLKSTLFGIQAVAPGMIAQGGGSIINIASLAASLGSPNAAAYCVSKAAVAQLTNVAAIELAPKGVRVNAIGPGTIQTEMSTSFYSTPRQQEIVLSRIPMGRPGEADEIAGVAVFLGSSDSSYVTGKTIYVDGGRLGLNLTMAMASAT